jgi:hypothetical protein
MKAFRIYVNGTFFGSALAKSKDHAQAMMGIEIKEKGVGDEPEGFMDHEWVWKEVKNEE